MIDYEMKSRMSGYLLKFVHIEIKNTGIKKLKKVSSSKRSI